MSSAAPPVQGPLNIELDVREVLRVGGIDPDGEVCAFLGGSLAEGLGNRSSDIDVYVLGRPALSFTPSHVVNGTPTHVTFHGARRLAFEYWDVARVEAMAVKLSALSLERAESADVLLEERLSAFDITLMHRVRTGVAWSHPAKLVELQALFDFPKLARYLMHVSAVEIDRFHEDLCGALADFDLDAVLPFARDLIDHACDAYLHGQGSTNPKRFFALDPRLDALWLLLQEPRSRLDLCALLAQAQSLQPDAAEHLVDAALPVLIAQGLVRVRSTLELAHEEEAARRWSLLCAKD